MTFKDFIRLLNIRDDVLTGADAKQQLRRVPDEQFKLMFWVAADLFKLLKAEAERRGIWDEMIKRRPEKPAV